MSSLISIVSLIVQSVTLIEQLGVNEMAQQYFSGRPFVTFVTDFKVNLTLSNFSTPLLVYGIGSNYNDTRVTPGIIIYSGLTFNESFLAGIRWNADTKFLIITDNECGEDIISYLWDKNVCQLLALALKNGSIKFCIDSQHHCLLQMPRIIAVDHVENSAIEKFVIVPEMKNCTVNVSFINLAPFVLWDEMKGEMRGNEGSIVDLALKRLGITPKYINRHQTGWGTFQPPSGLLGDVYTKRSFLGFGALYPFVERDLKTTLLPLCVPADMGWAVPAGAGPKHPTAIVILISEFSVSVWIMTGIIYLFLIPLLHYFHKVVVGQDESAGDDFSWPLTVLQLILGIPTRDLKSKTMMITCLLYGFLLTTMYKSLMSSKLTAPSKIPEITSSKELVDSKLFLTGPKTLALILKNLGETDRNLNIIADRFHVNQSNTIVLLRELVNFEQSAVFRHIFNLIYTSTTDPKLMNKVHIMEEASITFQAVLMLQKESCTWRQLRKKYVEICEAGLASKWIRDNSGSLGRGSEAGPRKLDLHDIKGFLLMILLGWGISGFAFGGELAVFWFRKVSKNSRKRRTKSIF